MVGGKDLLLPLPNNNTVDFSDGENSRTKPSSQHHHHHHNNNNNKKGSSSSELTLSYLCHRKPKQVVVASSQEEIENNCVERDFLSLSEKSKDNASKRSIDEEEHEECETNNKKQKLETLNLSLALPDVSLSLTASNALQNCDRPNPTLPTLSSCSNDYTTSSFFSHNPSCSLTENFEYSMSKNDQIWCCGEGTNGSVHSRFKPIGDGVGLVNHKSASTSDNVNVNNHSFFPSELASRARFEAQSEGSRGKSSENVRGLEFEGGKMMKKVSGLDSEIVLRGIVSESIPTMALTFQEFSDEVIVSIKEHLKSVIETPEKNDELASLRNWLDRRSDLTKETLLKCHIEQLRILVAVKTGLVSFLFGKFEFTEMVEVFLYVRCRNVNCKSLLPVDDCDCKICKGNMGFCSSCMCPVCLSFDCASNTCSWVGCDVCSHWCHAACALQRNLIKPGPSLKGPSWTSEMQFHCIGCGHPSAMFGFVKDVFVCCAKDWGLENLMKELDCVRQIFMGSKDRKGKELHIKTGDMLLKLRDKLVSPLDACNYIIQFFSYADGMSDLPASGISSKDFSTPQANLTMDTTSLSQSKSLLTKYTYDMSYSKPPSLLGEVKNETDFHLEALLRKGDLKSLECIVQVKEAEARMFQTKADDARKEAENYQRMIKTKAAQMEEEYAERLGKLCLHEAKEKRKKKFEELNVLENSQLDYLKMKSKMEDEIIGLLKRMEATKHQWV